jgi:hypothetical protein
MLESPTRSTPPTHISQVVGGTDIVRRHRCVGIIPGEESSHLMLLCIHKQLFLAWNDRNFDAYGALLRP